MRSCDSSGNMRRKNGSLPNGLTWRRCAACTLTTEGVTRLSIGASDGIGWPSTAAGSAATAGAGRALAAAGSVADAGACSASRMAVAANPPNAAAAARTSRVGAGRMGGGVCVDVSVTGGDYVTWAPGNGRARAGPGRAAPRRSAARRPVRSVGPAARGHLNRDLPGTRPRSIAAWPGGPHGKVDFANRGADLGPARHKMLGSAGPARPKQWGLGKKPGKTRIPGDRGDRAVTTQRRNTGTLEP